MNAPTSAVSLVIPPLIERHVGDAAFYWAQHDRSVHSPLINLEELYRFDRLLDAHLDGIRAAGDTGWQLAQKALQRWNGAAEVFVCAALALGAENECRQTEVIVAVQRDPRRLLRGLISATLWLPRRQTQQWLQSWINPDQSILLQTAAWRLAALEPGLFNGLAHSQALFLQATQHNDAHVRAAACRAGVHIQQAEKALQAALSDPATAVAAESAIALQRRGNTQGRAHLLAAVLQLNEEANASSGYYKKQALHRLGRWIRYLALALPAGTPEIETMLESLPPRLALQFILHHGDCARLPWVQEQMHNPECARLAGWVWSCLTGIDLQANGLTIRQSAGDASHEYPTDELDPGLPMPHAHAIARFKVDAVPDTASILGKPVESLNLSHVWRQAPQAIRWIVVQHSPDAAHLNTRWHGRDQRARLTEAV